MEKQRKGGKSKNKKDSLPYFAKMNSTYQKHTFKTKFEEAFKNHNSFEDESGAVLHSDPFQCSVLPSILKDAQFLEGLKDELLDQIFYDKNNDLYKFQQTDDLKKISAPHVRAIRKFLYEDVVDWLRDVTGIPLTDQVDMTCSRYDYTDVLLCHDDELDTRRIAFILYLVPPWKEQDGGTLDLYSMDEHGQPKEIVKSVVPAWNSLAWFEVTEASHHQVAEVLAQDKTRLSVNGWFHGPPVPRPARYVEPALPLCPCGSLEEEKVYEWINPIYLEPDVQSQIQAKFESDSEIELQGFIQEEKYHELLEALRSENVTWDKVGPANKRNYLCLGEESTKASQVISECVALFRSEAMFLTLSNLTGLSLHPLASNSSSSEDDDENNSDINADSDTETGSYTEIVPKKQTTEDKNNKSKSKKGCTIECEESEVVNDDEKEAGSEDSSSERAAKPRRKRRKLNSGSEGGKSDKSNKSADLANSTADSSEDAKPRSRCRCEVRRWEQGSYTLVHDTDMHGAEFALDAMLFCGCKGWQQEYGGSTSYIAKGEDEELLTVSPAENSLALVYRDKDTLHFVKHINDQIQEMKAPEPRYYDVAFVYYE